jgi:hypothetical protein
MYVVWRSVLVPRHLNASMVYTKHSHFNCEPTGILHRLVYLILLKLSTKPPSLDACFEAKTKASLCGAKQLAHGV